MSFTAAEHTKSGPDKGWMRIVARSGYPRSVVRVPPLRLVAHAASLLCSGVVGCSFLESLDGYTGGPGVPDAASGPGPEAGIPEAGSPGDGETGPPAAARTRIYVLGGSATASGSTSVADVRFAEIQDDGSLGAWVSAAPLAQPLHYASSVQGADFAALLGGENANGVFDTILRSALTGSADGGAAGGTLGGFTVAGTFPNARLRHASVLRDGFVFVVGGYTGASSLDGIYSGRLDRTTQGPFRSVASLPYVRARMTLAQTATNLYVIGGTTTGDAKVDDIHVVPFEPEGELGAVRETTPLPKATEHPRAFVQGDNLVVLGGESSDGSEAAVTIFPITASGDLGAGVASAPMPEGRQQFGLTVVRDHVYVIGGLKGENAVTTVYVGDVAANGAISAWRTTTPLPSPIGYFGLAVF